MAQRKLLWRIKLVWISLKVVFDAHSCLVLSHTNSRKRSSVFVQLRLSLEFASCANFNRVQTSERRIVSWLHARSLHQSTTLTHVDSRSGMSLKLLRGQSSKSRRWLQDVSLAWRALRHDKGRLGVLLTAIIKTLLAILVAESLILN